MKSHNRVVYFREVLVQIELFWQKILGEVEVVIVKGILYCTRKRTISHWKVEKNKTAGNAGTLVSSLGAGFSQ